MHIALTPQRSAVASATRCCHQLKLDRNVFQHSCRHVRHWQHSASVSGLANTQSLFAGQSGHKAQDVHVSVLIHLAICLDVFEWTMTQQWHRLLIVIAGQPYMLI